VRYAEYFVFLVGFGWIWLDLVGFDRDVPSGPQKWFLALPGFTWLYLLSPE
jgi:hypothetical protein